MSAREGRLENIFCPLGIAVLCVDALLGPQRHLRAHPASVIKELTVPDVSGLDISFKSTWRYQIRGLTYAGPWRFLHRMHCGRSAEGWFLGAGCCVRKPGTRANLN